MRAQPSVSAAGPLSAGKPPVRLYGADGRRLAVVVPGAGAWLYDAASGDQLARVAAP